MSCPAQSQTGAIHAKINSGPVTTITSIPNGTSYWITSPGTYRLANDIEWQGGPLGLTPFLITASNVTLDLNGKTVLAVDSTSNSYNSTGISVGESTQVVITNGILEGFREYGITVTESRNVTLSGIIVRDIHNPTTVPITDPVPNAVAGMAFLLCSNVTVSHSTISNISGGPQVSKIGRAHV